MLSTRSLGLAAGLVLVAQAVLKAEVPTWQLGGSQPSKFRFKRKTARFSPSRGRCPSQGPSPSRRKILRLTCALVSTSNTCVSFFRWARKFSIIDETALTPVSGTSGGQGNQARSLLGTISEFEVYGEGFPKRATYRSKIIDLGVEQNFGRLFFAATLMRFVDGEAVETPNARALAEVEVRTGRDLMFNIGGTPYGHLRGRL